MQHFPAENLTGRSPLISQVSKHCALLKRPVADLLLEKQVLKDLGGKGVVRPALASTLAR